MSSDTVITLIVFFVILFLICALIDRIRYRIICPNGNCNYRGMGKVMGRRSGCLLIVLLLFGVLPGILYLLFSGSSGVCCPKCGMRIR